MKRRILKRIRNLFRRSAIEIEPDEIFLDSSNLPAFDRNQFEGRIEKPVTKGTVLRLSAVFAVLFLIVIWKVWVLQGEEGEAYAIQSETNRLRHVLLFSERGVIHDRNGIELAWNVPSDNEPFSRRTYIDEPGFSHLLGYVGYPLKDALGVYYQEDFVGIEGVEHYYNDILGGENGLKIIETNALNEIQSENVIRPAHDGKSVTLSIDAELQTALHAIIRRIAQSSNFKGGAGIVMDIKTGELLALTNYPEYDPKVLADGGPASLIAEYVEDERTPFLNRAISGLYAPGSIVKPFIALGALEENVISPEKEILSTGKLVIPNPFVDGAVSIFRDWRPQGYVDMRHAIAVSSDIYFYIVGGGLSLEAAKENGLEPLEGLGIDNIEHYMKLFGIGEETNIDLPAEALGTIPNPEWKKEHFPGDPWRVGDTYNTSIGQYGFQVTPIQMVRGVAAIASEGELLEPHVVLGEGVHKTRSIPVEKEYFDVVQEGMRQAVTDGTAAGLWFPDIPIAAKTGTAEVGAKKEFVNSWTMGFFPYEKPRYAFVVLMERAPSGTLIGSVAAAKELFEWMKENTPEYIE